MVESKKWKMWHAFLDLRTCIECKEKHGKVYAMKETPKPSPPLHNNCRCEIIKMKSILAGNATNNGERGQIGMLNIIKHYLIITLLPRWQKPKAGIRKLGIWIR